MLSQLLPPHSPLTVLAVCCGAAAVFGIGYSLIAGLCLARFFAPTSPEPAEFPPVTLVKPLCGAERALLGNLASFCDQDYPGPVQIVFGVNLATDPALQTIAELRRLHPKANITVVNDSRLHGSNRKVSNLINMLGSAQHEVLVFADSDVRVPRNYLRVVIGELQQPGVGLVTCIYVGEPEPSIWSRLSAMSTNCQFLPGAILAINFGLARPCFGQTIALKRAMLERIGGLERFSDHLAEDHALGEAVRQAGGRVAIPSITIGHDCVEVSFAQLVAHELRWNRTIHTIDPVGHVCSVLAHPLPFALLAVVLSGFSLWSWQLTGAALISRLALKLWTDHLLGRSARDWWLQPFSDVVLFGLFAASFLSTRVSWRGFDFAVREGGLLCAQEKK